MKKIMIAATLAGAAAAGVILYLQSRNDNSKKIKDAAGDAYKTMNNGIGQAERLGQHAMG